MSFKYFLDMAPEDEVINPSLLTKFRKLRLKDAELLNLLMSKTVSIAIEKDIIKSKSIIVDATHSLSRSNHIQHLKFSENVQNCCEMAIKKARRGKNNRGKNQALVYYFDVEKYKTCPLKDNCYKTGAKTKTYSITIKSDQHSQQMAFQETDYYKEKTKHRYKIEAKNSGLKNVHGYHRAISYGIENMQMQGALAIFTVNLKRIIKLTS